MQYSRKSTRHSRALSTMPSPPAVLPQVFPQQETLRSTLTSLHTQMFMKKPFLSVGHFSVCSTHTYTCIYNVFFLSLPEQVSDEWFPLFHSGWGINLEGLFVVEDFLFLIPELFIYCLKDFFFGWVRGENFVSFYVWILILILCISKQFFLELEYLRH